MRKIATTLALVAVTAASLNANATLIDRGGGLIYDDVLDITWLQNANLAATNTFGVSGIDANGRMTWNTANQWIDAMNAADYLGYNDWRLPTLGPVNGSTFAYGFSNDGSTDYAYNISAPGSAYPGSTASELAYMYYVDLGLKGEYDASGTFQADFGIFGNGTYNGTDFSSYGQNDVGLIDNLQADLYWSGLEYAPGTSSAWDFNAIYGLQVAVDKGSDVSAWAVRPGDVAVVPEPHTYGMMLAGLALVGFSARRRRFRV